MHEAVEDAGGLAVGLMLDVDASDIGSFAITGPMFAGSPEPPIAEVVVLLGGPASLFFSATAHGPVVQAAVVHVNTLTITSPSMIALARAP